jgi:uncharacterized protein DUF1707
MAGPGEEIAAGAHGHGRLRSSHADREQVIAMLKAAFVQGRLTKDELDARLGQTFASRTYADLAALTTDLPAGLIAAPPPGKPVRARTRPPLGKVVAGAALIVPPPAMVAAAVLTGNGQLVVASVLVVIFFFMAWMVAGAQIVANWHDKRSRGQLPQGPAPSTGDQASQRATPSAGAGQLPRVVRAPRDAAEAAPRRSPRPQSSGCWPPHGWRTPGRRYVAGCAGQ